MLSTRGEKNDHGSYSHEPYNLEKKWQGWRGDTSSTEVWPFEMSSLKRSHSTVTIMIQERMHWKNEEKCVAGKRAHIQRKGRVCYISGTKKKLI